MSNTTLTINIKIAVLRSNLLSCGRECLFPKLSCIWHTQNIPSFQQVDIVIYKSIWIGSLQRQHCLLNRDRTVWPDFRRNRPKRVATPRDAAEISTFLQGGTTDFHITAAFAFHHIRVHGGSVDRIAVK